MMFRIKLYGTKEVLKLEGDFRRMTNKGAEAVASKTVDLIRMNIAEYGKIWKGNLFESVKAERIGRTQVAIKMLLYGMFIESGHAIRRGKLPRKLVSWALDKLSSVYGESYARAWLKSVSESGHYVYPVPIISDAMNALRPQIPYIMKEHMVVR